VAVALVLSGCPREAAPSSTTPSPEHAAPSLVDASAPREMSDASGASDAPIARAEDSPTAPDESAAPPRDASARELARSPEENARAMTGKVDCDDRACRAGREVCVASPNGKPSRCAPIVEWVDHRTPRPRGGFPPLAGITACSGSHNCPEGTVCCLHEIGNADVQAIVCHASLSECRDGVETCREGARGDCRTPGTTCKEVWCKQP
jgi:hypothetical protein